MKATLKLNGLLRLMRRTAPRVRWEAHGEEESIEREERRWLELIEGANSAPQERLSGD